MRPNSTHLQHRSFSLERRSTINKSQYASSPVKSFISKSSKHVKLSQEKNNIDLMSSSVPIEIYFNPQIRKQYVNKVIDNFFTATQSPKNIQNPQLNNSFLTTKKQPLRNRLLSWKKQNKPVSDFEIIESSKFIRSSPKKSIISEFSQQKSPSLIHINSISKLQKSQVSLSNSFVDNLKKSSMNQSRIFRPLSEQKKKPRNLFFDDNKSLEGDSYSVFLNSSISPKQKFRKQAKKITESNKFFQEYNMFQDGEAISKMRRYIGQNNPLLIRQEKLSKKGVKTLWRHSMTPNTLEYPSLKSIKDQLSQQFTYGSCDKDSYKQIYIKPYYNQLFLNKNEQLVDIITSMTKFIIENKGKILTGAFQVQNLYKINEKQFLLKDLGSSAIVQNIRIRDRNLGYLYPPYFKDQAPNGKWMVRPEYLAPQVVESFSRNDFQWISLQPQKVIASQVWSLGCMLLQILTLISLNSDTRCRMKSNPEIFRRGFLSIKFNENHVDLESLHKKQKALQMTLNRNLQFELRNVPIQTKILNILHKMLIYEPKKRIKPQQILSDLKN